MRTPAFSPPCFPSYSRDFRQGSRTGPNLAGRFPDETPQTAQPGSRSKVIVRPGSVSPMVTDDYRGLPKGSVRPVFGKTPLPASRMGGNRRPDATLHYPHIANEAFRIDLKGNVRHCRDIQVRAF